MITIIHTGTLHGVDWRIVEQVVRAPEFRVSVDGTYLATEYTYAAAMKVVEDVVGDLIDGGLVGTLEPA